MALAPDEYRSGGQVFDGEGRRRIVIGGGAGLAAGEFRSGGIVVDADGREVVSSASGGGTDTSTLVTLAPGTSARNTIVPTGAAVVPLTVKGVTGQTANLQEWRDGAGAIKARIDPTGKVYVFGQTNASVSAIDTNTVRLGLHANVEGKLTAGGTAALGQGSFYADAAATPGIVIRGAASQTADLLQARNSADTVLASITPAGDVSLTQAGKGVIVRSPDGLSTRRISIDNTGAIVATIVV